MEESIFFNRGNAVASNVDLKILYEEAQLEKDRTEKSSDFVIVQDSEDSKYILFHQEDLEKSSNSNNYKIIQYI